MLTSDALADDHQTAKAARGENAIVISESDYKWSNDTAPVLHAFGLAVPAGQLLAVIGKTGSGKSSMLVCRSSFWSSVLASGCGLLRVRCLVESPDPAHACRFACGRWITCTGTRQRTRARGHTLVCPRPRCKRHPPHSCLVARCPSGNAPRRWRWAKRCRRCPTVQMPRWCEGARPT